MSKNTKSIVIGIGNFLLMDEGVGIHAINELEKHRLPSNVTLCDGGTGGFKLIDLMHGVDKVFFIDAVRMGKPPGTIEIFTPGDVQSTDQRKKYSLHDTDLLEVLKMAWFLEYTPEIKILGIQPKTIAPGTTLSQELQASIPDIINRLLNELEEKAVSC